MTGSISVQVFPYRRGLVRESSKSFHFFSAIPFAPEVHLYFEISILQGRKQVFQIVFPKDSSAVRVGQSCAIATELRKRGQSSISASN
jgi:hypothetical protein